MAEELNKPAVTEVEATEAEAVTKKSKQKKSSKKVEKKPNAFVRLGKAIAKLCKDVAGELKKVTWTPKSELNKGTKLVVATVVAIGISIAVVDTLFSWIINSIAGLIG